MVGVVKNFIIIIISKTYPIWVSKSPHGVDVDSAVKKT